MALKLGLIGCGRMGNEIEHLAPEKGHQIIAKYHSQKPFTHEAKSENVDVFIDFTHPKAIVANVDTAAKIKKPLVIGTTGWIHELESVKNTVESSKIGVLYASNFSIGMNLFLKIVNYASSLIDQFEDYDPFVHEMHHRGKADSPSGTALSLANILLENIKRKDNLLTQTSEGPISPKGLHVTSTRAGNIPGTHLVAFDSDADTIELKHTARNRRGFALGALYAAEWIIGKEGLFTMDDLLSD